MLNARGQLYLVAYTKDAAQYFHFSCTSAGPARQASLSVTPKAYLRMRRRALGGEKTEKLKERKI